MRSGRDAALYGAELRRVMRFLGASDGNMAEGSMRCDVNVSVRPKGQEAFGTKVEVKNMNSFTNMQKAIEFEIERQVRHACTHACMHAAHAARARLSACMRACAEVLYGPATRSKTKPCLHGWPKPGRALCMLCSARLLCCARAAAARWCRRRDCGTRASRRRPACARRRALPTTGGGPPSGFFVSRLLPATATASVVAWAWGVATALLGCVDLPARGRSTAQPVTAPQVLPRARPAGSRDQRRSDGGGQGVDGGAAH